MDAYRALMAKTNPKRPATVNLNLSGRSAGFISKVLNVPRRAVYDTLKRFKELEICRTGLEDVVNRLLSLRK